MHIKITTSVEVPGFRAFVGGGVYLVGDDVGDMLIERGQAVKVSPPVEPGEPIEKKPKKTTE